MTVDEHEDWRRWVTRWEALIASLRGRLPDDELDEISFRGVQEPSEGTSDLLCRHELGLIDLVPQEEDELWSLAADEGVSDAYLVPESVRRQSVRGRPVRTLLPARYLAGGAHGAGAGAPGKTEFPAAWSPDDCIRTIMDVARRPSAVTKLATGDFRATGERDDVVVSVVVSPEGHVLTGYPVRGHGVVRNPLDEGRTPAVARLQGLVEALVPDDRDDARTDLDELMAVGEWPHVIASLRTMALDDAQRQELTELAVLAGLPADDAGSAEQS